MTYWSKLRPDLCFTPTAKPYRLYGLFNGSRLIGTSRVKKLLIDRRNAIPEAIRKNTFLAEKFIYGPREHQQSHWMFNVDE